MKGSFQLFKPIFSERNWGNYSRAKKIVVSQEKMKNNTDWKKVAWEKAPARNGV